MLKPVLILNISHIFNELILKFNFNKKKSDFNNSLFLTLSSLPLLRQEYSYQFSGKAAFCIKSINGLYFEKVKEEIILMLEVSKAELRINYRIEYDSFGYLWILFENDDTVIEDGLLYVLNGLNSLIKIIEDHGVKDLIFIIIIRFNNFNHEQERLYLILNYNATTFYPYIKSGNTRNNKKEILLANSLQDKLPIEKDKSKWYSVIEMPI